MERMHMNGKSLLPPEEPGPAAVPMVYVREDAVWEYQQLTFRPPEQRLPDEETLNALGAEGWELAAVVTVAAEVFFYLKRLRR
jgi:hypothetical protein